MKRALGLIFIIIICFAGFLFLLMPPDLKGTIGQENPYLGFPLFLLDNWQGIILIFLAILVLAVFLYAKELSMIGGRFYRKLINPVIQEYYNANLVLLRRFQATEAALDRFASSMERYSQHLESHTSAIQKLNDASSELRKSAIEQSHVITLLLKTIEYKTYRDDMLRMEPIFHRLERKAVEVEKTGDEPEGLKIEDGILPISRAKSPSGCALNYRVLNSRKNIHN